MRKEFWVGLVLACIVRPAMAQDEDFSKVQIKATKVGGSVYLLEGSGGNIGVSAGEDGIVIVDDQYAPLAEKIRAALKGISDKPLRFVINTHYHEDHTDGNATFQKDAPVIAQENVRKRLAEGGTTGNYGAVVFPAKPQPREALPILTFAHDVTVHLNGEEIRVLHIPDGHTDGDSVILFTRSNVVHLGDDFVTYGFPFIDLSGGGSVKGLIAGLEGLLKTLPEDVKVIPGHGPVSNLDDVRRFLAMLQETRAAVARGVKQGKSLAAMQKADLLAPWKRWSGDFITSEQWLVTLFNELTGTKSAPLLKHN